jgi:hypothetical protein
MTDIPLHGVHSPGRALSYTDDEIPVPRDVLETLRDAARAHAANSLHPSNAMHSVVHAACNRAEALLNPEASR